MWRESRNLLYELGRLEKSNQAKLKYYHYTSINGVLGIFKDFIEAQEQTGIKGIENNFPTTCKFYASNIRFLNDAEEYKEGEEFLKKKGIENIKIHENIYSISFCKTLDLLSQWKWYGKDSGIAIEFDLDNIDYIWYYQICDGEKVELTDNRLKPIAVKYTLNEKEHFYQDIVDELNWGNDDEKLSNEKLEKLKKVFIPFCKNIGFAEEGESRLIFQTYNRIQNSDEENNFDNGLAKLLYMIGGRPNNIFDINYVVAANGVAKPTLTVKFKHKSDLSIIKSLTVGPGQNQQLIFNALIHIFDRENYHFYDDATDITREDNSDLNYYYADAQGRLIKEPGEVKYLTHKCKNGIFIRKSAIPFRN